MIQVATGFLYAYPTSEGQADDGFKLWLVTCKHVIQTTTEKNLNEIMVRLNKSGNRGKQTFRLSHRQGEGSGWTLHQEADVAVIPISWSVLDSREVQWETFGAGRNAMRREEAVKFGLSEGDEVFVLGFPIGWRSGRQDYPIVRHGMLAQIQGWLRKEHDTFLVDGSGFPGNSGGPIITKPQFGAIEGTKNVLGSWLLGMVSERKISLSPVVETADLIESVSMDLIDETVRRAMQHEGSTDK